MNCDACRLASTRKSIVQGRGTLPCEVLFLGEGPGRTEDLLGEAFCGPSGRLLDKIVAAVGVRSYYVDNIVCCHPTDTRRGLNRAPRGDEVLACRPRVERLIDAARPQAIVWVGEVAERYYGKSYPGYRILHPAALLRAGGSNSPHYPLVVRGLRAYLERMGIDASPEGVTYSRS
jgi:uracil-DNA glycosylase